MEWLRSLILPMQGSTYAGEVDTLYMFLVWLSVFFFLLIAGVATYSVIRFRHKPGDVTPHWTHNNLLEVVWTLVPLVILIFIFFWGLRGYLKASVAPGDAQEIRITAKKWVWQFEYPDGNRAINELHVPLNKPVRFLMSSEDVIHDFFVPDMRVKHDILPDRYTEVWFTPTVAGKHHVECAEYCGRGHSDMAATIYVDDDAAYEKWLETGGVDPNMPLDQLGAQLYQSKGCSTCHSIDGTPGQGPSWKGVFGHPVTLSNGPAVVADENYIRESILVPSAKVVKGYDNIMPVFQGVLRQREIDGLVAYIKSLGK
jgi:cytochrome c oxidase subunit II